MRAMPSDTPEQGVENSAQGHTTDTKILCDYLMLIRKVETMQNAEARSGQINAVGICKCKVVPVL